MNPKIAIIGAGPGGCMLARLLAQRSIPCVIYEGEESLDYRSQGGSLDLRAKTGLEAIRRSGLYVEFLKHARYEGEALLVTDKKQTTWVRRSPGKQGQKNQIQEAPEIDRAVLRKMLAESLPTDMIRWGHRLLRLEPDLSLHFENGHVEGGFDLIVGADGAWSKVRTLLTSEKPHFSTIGGVMLHIHDADTKAPECVKFVNRGSVFAYSDHKSLSGQQLGDGSLYVGAWSVRDEDWMKKADYDVTDIDAVKKELLNVYSDWTPDLRHLLEKAEGPVLARNLYMFPPGFRFDHKKGVTVLGDAAHLMTPFAGIGVNTAFYDAMLLADAITEYTKSGAGDLDSFVLDYEEKMWANAKEVQTLTYNVMNDIILTPGAPRKTIESWVLRHLKADIPAFLYPIAVAVIYTWFFFYKLFV